MRIVISLGGLAIGDGLDRQLSRIREVAPRLAEAVEPDTEIIITHGNGHQIHMMQRAFAVASAEESSVPVIDLPECGAMSQGYIGYHLQQALGNELRRAGKARHVATIITQIEVEPDDPSLASPSKPIGPHLTEAQARALEEGGEGFSFVDDGRGYRRVVASPRPRRIVESESILNLLDNDFIVVACGGGGIPVVRDTDDWGCYRGIPAVIEKDSAAARLGENCDADLLVFLTDVDAAYEGFGTDEQRALGQVSVPRMRELADAGEFGAGSMGPKVRAALHFCEQRPDRACHIGMLEDAARVVRGESGTRISYRYT